MPQSVRVMVVDDSRTQRIILRRKIEGDTHAVVVAEAGSGDEALQLYAQHRPDVVFLDVVMPGMDGAQTLAALRTLDPDARVVMASSLGSSGVVEDCLRNGAISFLQKPFVEDVLVRVLDEALSERAAG